MTGTKIIGGHRLQRVWLFAAAVAALVLLGGPQPVRANGGAVQLSVASQSAYGGAAYNAVYKKGRALAKARDRFRMRLH